MTAIPPVYTASRPETAIFYKGDVKSGTKIAVMPPAVYKKGEWFGVLGSCAVNAASTVQANSYGVADYPSRLAGTPVTLSRFISQQIIGQFKGNVACSSVTAGTISRVICWIAHQGGTETFGAGSGGTPPSLARSDPNPPSIGFKAGLLAKAGTATNKGGAWVFGLKRTAQKIPGLGTINVLPIVATVPVAVIPATGTTLSINIPKNNQFIGAKIPMQLAVLEGYGLGLSNGAEWQIGK
ncbi:MAG: hypothetical protein QF412_01180 [Planctomycetota bacterium]|jgi:hypothetical protein|nr:hypothetical protein [Planctomycetota bacterium]